MMTRREALAASAALLAFQQTFSADVDPTRVAEVGKTLADARLGALKSLQGYFPFAVPKSKEEWESRRKTLREQILVAEGLWPIPEKTPLNASVHGKIERDGYTIEKVSFASMPGHYVTGNLYKPANATGKQVGILFAHGHWANGRFHDAGERAAKASVDAGGESDLDRGRYFMQVLPATLAKLGCVVFQYDMVGYADSTAIKHREGFTDAQAELRLQSFMGLQTWNSVRALDFLLSLPDVDEKRIGMTGASGGGTQTFILSAIDDRISAAFPAVMVSTGMQGGCICENCSLLRVGTGNVEIAGLFAPKPLAMSAANDWTKELMTKGFPELQRLYDLYGKKNGVQAKAWLEFGHQYNQKAREFMYNFFASYLIHRAEEIREQPFKPVVPPTDLSVYDDQHPRPKDELGVMELRQKMTFASDDQMTKITPNSPERLKEFRHVVGTALRAMASTDWPAKDSFPASAPNFKDTIGGVNVIKAIIGWPGANEEVPVLIVLPPGGKPKKGVVWLHPDGKSSLFANGKPVSALKSFLDAGVAVAAPDLFGTGELAKANTVDEKFAGFTFGYNRSLLANRVHDTITTLAFAAKGMDAVHLVGWGAMGPVAVLAKAIAGDAVAKTAADMNAFRFEDIQRTDDPMMLPGAVKYGGMGAFIALCAPGEMLIHNNKRTAIGKTSKAAYNAAGAEGKLTINGDKLEDVKVVEWLLK